MKIQLNAAEDDESEAPGAPETRPARPDVGSHTVSMSSLLSTDTSTPRAAAAGKDDESGHVVQLTVPPPRAGLSSLMNSPMPDGDEEMVDARPLCAVVASPDLVGRGDNSLEASEPPPSGQDDVEMEQESATSGAERSAAATQQMMDEHAMDALRDEELRALRPEFLSAVRKLLKSDPSAPSAAKRQKKSKQQRKTRGTAADAALLEVQRCLRQLELKVSSQFASQAVLSDVVRFCLAFCGVIDAKDPVASLVVTRNGNTEHERNAAGAVDVGATLERLQHKPLYSQLADVMGRAVLSSTESSASELLTQVLEWILSRPEPTHWTWLLASVAHMNSYCLQDFLLREAIARNRASAPKSVALTLLLPVLEFLTTQNPSQMADILRDLLEECSAGAGDAEVCRVPVKCAVQRLVTLASESAVLVQACDESLQWIVTEELVLMLASKLAAQGDDGVQTNGNAKARLDAPELTLETQLMQFLEKRSAELRNSGFQLLLLLQNLSQSTESRPQLTEATVASFQRRLLEFAVSEPSRAFVQGVYRFLPFICQSSLQLLGHIAQEKGGSRTETTVDTTDKDVYVRRFQYWKHWLRLLAQRVSRKDVTERLVEAELMLAEFDELPLALPVTAIQPADRALCELLGSILAPTSEDYVAFVRKTVQTCPTSTPRARRRLLAVVQTLLSLNTDGDTSAVELPVKLQLPSAEQDASSCLKQLCSVPTWRDTQDAFARWKGFRGVDLWESFLDLACSKDPVVASRALTLVARTPFLSLEDPMWQYRCVRKLSVVFFSLLRQYRSELVHQGEPRKPSGEKRFQSESNLPSRLQTLKLVLFRVLALDGGVAHYPSSVHSVFASLWLDALLSTTSATSIPTHFPDGVNFGQHVDEPEDAVEREDARIVIRCERTISSKCTNLQSSQVITRVPEALVYRKTLDSSWAREMDAARICSVYATELFSQLVGSTGTASSLLEQTSQSSQQSAADEDEQCEHRLKTIVDLLLERVIPCCGIPSDETYKDTLPNRSSFDVDLRVEQWLNHFPAFLPLLRVVITTSNALGSSQLLRLVPVLKSALIVLLGHWNSVKGELSVENVDVPPYMRNRNQLTLSCQLMRLLRATGWLPAPLAKTAELLPLTTPADIRGILFSCWFYLSDHPPQRTDSRVPTPTTSATTSPISSGSSPAGFSISGLATSGPSASTSNPPLEFYLIPLRKALHRNIHKVGAKYALFMC